GDTNHGDSNVGAFPAAGCGAPTCEPIWTARVGRRANTNAAVANGVVYVATADAALVALDEQTGRQLWRVPLAFNSLIGSPAVAGSVVYVGVQGAVGA